MDGRNQTGALDVEPCQRLCARGEGSSRVIVSLLAGEQTASRGQGSGRAVRRLEVPSEHPAQGGISIVAGLFGLHPLATVQAEKVMEPEAS